jgi:predicted membrane protein
MLSKISQAQKQILDILTYAVEFKETEWWLSEARVWGKGEIMVTGYRASIRQEEWVGFFPFEICCTVSWI